MKIKLDKQDIELLSETLSDWINLTLWDIFSEDYIITAVLDSFEKHMTWEIWKQISITVEEYIKNHKIV